MASLSLFAKLLLLVVVTINEISSDSIEDSMYTVLDATPCVRLLHKNGVVGCATPKTALRGTIRYVQNDDQLNQLLHDPPSNRIALVLPNTLFNKTTASMCRDSLDLAGIIVLQGQKPEKGYSSDFSSPQWYMDFHQCNNFTWNPLGDGIIWERYDFAIISLPVNQQNKLLEFAKSNEENIQNNAFAPYAAEFDYYMYATESSTQCLNDALCFPIGGYSVWTSYGKLNKTKPVVMGITGMDSTAFFHDMSYGADASVSGVSATLAAAVALSHVPNITMLPSQIVFALFEGEQWGYVGSRKFVNDIMNFTCNQPSETANNDGTVPCDRPYKPQLDFTNIDFNRIQLVLELNQIGLNNTLYLHRERNHNLTDDLVSTIQNVANNLSVISVETAPEDIPCIPPSSSRSFLNANPSLPVVVITDHKREYINKYYHSEYDDETNRWLGGEENSGNSICDVATLTARVLYLKAGGNINNVAKIKADCRLVDSIFNCLTSDFSCKLAQKYDLDTPGPVSEYSGVYQLMKREYMSGTSLFFSKLLSEYGMNGSIMVNYHDAVDPELVFNYDTGLYDFGNLSNTMLWTESNWPRDKPSGGTTRIYRVENPHVEALMIGLGITILMVSFFVVYATSEYCCKKRFKSV